MDMENLEKVRNCVAHNRAPTPDELINYNRSVPEVKKKIKDFFDNLILSYIDI